MDNVALALADSRSEALESNTTLTELYASGHALDKDSLAALAAMLPRNATLTSLNVGDGSLGDQGLAILAAGVGTSPSLTRLDLENKGIEGQGVAALAAAVAQAPASKLKELVLSRNPLSAEGAAALAPILPRLEVLELSDCRWASGLDASASSPGPTALAWALRHCGQMRKVRGQHLARTATGGVCVPRVLLDSWPHPCCPASQLALDGSAFDGASLAELGAALGPCGALRELTMARVSWLGGRQGGVRAELSALMCCGDRLHPRQSQCLMGPSVGALLAPMAAAGRQLDCLDLSLCELGDEGAEKVAEAIRSGLVVRALRLHGNGIGATGTEALCGAVRTSLAASQGVTLTLDMGGNPGGGAALRALGDARGLTSLSLFDARVADDDVRWLAENVCRGAFVDATHLSLAGNSVSSEPLVVLLDALSEPSSMPGLQVLELAANPGTKEESFEVRAAPRHNTRGIVAGYGRKLVWRVGALAGSGRQGHVCQGAPGHLEGGGYRAVTHCASGGPTGTWDRPYLLNLCFVDAFDGKITSSSPHRGRRCAFERLLGVVKRASHLGAVADAWTGQPRWSGFGFWERWLRQFEPAPEAAPGQVKSARQAREVPPSND